MEPLKAGAAGKPLALAASNGEAGEPTVLGLPRTVDFWRRAVYIYGSYKAAQLQSLFLKAAGKSDAEVHETVWVRQHTWAGEEMYKLCIALRGFYLKAGQFIGSRSDFVPEQICRKLSLLCDKVPPMSAETTRAALQRELGVSDLSQLFEWIDLDTPLGSASISQVHKARLRRFSRGELANAAASLRRQRPVEYVLGPGEGAWEVCNALGMSLRELRSINKGVDLERLQPGQTLRVIHPKSLDSYGSSGGGASASGGGGCSESQVPAVAALMHAVAVGDAPRDGVVAVKVQYPNALPVMTGDLSNIRAAAFYLSKTELKFDLVSAVDELNKQIRLEFDFTREARVMDTIAEHLRPQTARLQIPRSVGGLVTRRALVMSFVEGVPLLEASSRVSNMSPRARDAAKRLILSRVSEAYGRMIFGEGLFQADGHPGNILIGRGGRVGLLDYGQSKQLPDEQRRTFAELVLALNRGRAHEISSSLGALGVVTERNDPEIRTEMAYGMFDTRGKVDPFDPNSPIKRSAISTFPPDMFFVLRVVQLLRGLANGMGINDFSCARQWAPFARDTLARARRGGGERRGLQHFLWPPLGVNVLPLQFPWRGGDLSGSGPSRGPEPVQPRPAQAEV
ncbi:hypothetical protein PLESTB_000081700 [Pleodorina starrii]|uniref:LysM domain-containing protein n=1 Tax=Pleodorina starrii TaxID=330485 RepID=A0A9W6BAP8_9CHLO|nr:hypothetical protein PLESTM_000078100 [Pleodorina starrii]GLC48305.1 hypothetical protein PLESTB_000081700 [Pleodorina starrii]GLC66590.1 hypothetical protein PLESTF_000447500 [Pleodorina starrii]